MIPDYKKPNELLIEVYKDTLLQASLLPFGVTNKYWFDDIFNLKYKPNRKGIIEVWNMDSISAAKELSVDGNKTAILNMASYKRPGGGVTRGSKAQEEALFRCSNLGFSISNKFYPLKNDEALYTSDVIFIKDFNYKNMPHINVDVLTIAAVNLNNNETFRGTNEYIEITYKKIRLMLQMAAHCQRVNNLVFGAWGCGVFKNDPIFIAKAFKECLSEGSMNQNFDKIIFAVINDHNSVSNNYNAFKTILS